MSAQDDIAAIAKVCREGIEEAFPNVSEEDKATLTSIATTIRATWYIASTCGMTNTKADALVSESTSVVYHRYIEKWDGNAEG